MGDRTQGAFAVVPKTDCAHLDYALSTPLRTDVPMSGACAGCSDPTENWVCLTCYALNCARGINGCSVVHATSDAHPVVLSLSDLSVWCYACDSYISHERLHPYKLAAYRRKFGEDPPGGNVA